MLVLADDEMLHYGVLGMKWGVRHDKPTKGRAKASKSSVSETSKKKGLTDKQKKALKIAGAVVVSAALLYGGYKLGQNYGVIQTLDKASGYPLIPKANKTEAYKSVNLTYGIVDGDTTNCAACSLASEMRERGLNVRATLTKGQKPTDVAKWYKNTELNYPVDMASTSYSKKGMDKFKGAILKEGDGTRGNLLMSFAQSDGSIRGHAVSYKVRGSEVIIQDAQRKAQMTWDEACERYRPCAGLTAYIRTDNKELDYDAIKAAKVIKSVAAPTAKKAAKDFKTDILNRLR